MSSKHTARWGTCRRTGELPPGFRVAAALQGGQRVGQPVRLLHLHLVLVVLVDGVAQGAGGGLLHLLVVAAQQSHQLVDAVQTTDLWGGPEPRGRA